MKSIKVDCGDGLILKCFYNDHYVRIDDSYKLSNKKVENIAFKIILKIWITSDISYNRTHESWTIEWIAHTRLYKWGLFKKHTKDVDIDEDESLFRRICYHIIAIDYLISVYLFS